MILSILFLLCAPLCVLGEEGNIAGPELVWELFDPKPVYDAKGFVASGDGGFVIAMNKWYPDQGLTGGYKSQDVVLLKIDRDGLKVWEKTYGGLLTEDSVVSIVSTRDGGFNLTITSRSSGWGQLYLLKIDSSGNRLWIKTYDGKIEEKPYRKNIVIKIQDGYIIANSSHFYKIDNDRKKTWEKSHTIHWDYALQWEASDTPVAWGGLYDVVGIIETDDHGFVLAGEVLGDLRVWKINGEGEMVWDRVYGNQEMVKDIVGSGDGGLIVAGYTQSFGLGARDAHIYKIDGNGQKIWEMSYGGPGWDSAECIIKAGDGGYVAAGYTTLLSSGDIYLVKVNNEGNKIWEAEYGTMEQDWAMDIERSKDGGFLVAGVTQSHAHNNIHAYLLKVNAGGEKLWERSFDLGKWGDVRGITLSDVGFVMMGSIWERSLGRKTFLMRFNDSGHLIWENAYENNTRGNRQCVVKNGNGFIIASRRGQTYMVDGNGNMLWEKNYAEELSEKWDLSQYDTYCGGDFIVPTCDGGHILQYPTAWSWYRDDIILFRINSEGEILQSNITPLNIDSPLIYEYSGNFILWQGMALGENGTFFIGGNIYTDPFTKGYRFPLLVKLRYSDLVNVVCDCQYLFPQLWGTINNKFSLAEAHIEAAKKLGTDTTIIMLMEQELENAENAQKICDLESAAMHMDWIITATPELYIPAAILLMPLFWAWKRTRNQYN